jgi:formate/nitrite transporter
MAEEETRLDALLPPAMARRAEEAGVRKVATPPASLFALAVLAGAFIALGGVFATTALAGTGSAPWGPARVLVGLAFSLGLILVVVGGAELFTGNNLVVMAWASRRVTTRALVQSWAIVYAGNFVGAVGTALLVFLSGAYRFGDGAWGATALAIAVGKMRLGFGQAVALGVLCNALVCLAVWLSYSARSSTDRVLVVVPPITAFVAAGFEHSIANMYFVPLALLIRDLDPAFGSGPHAESLTLGSFVIWNLVPVTAGNLIGGTLLVAAVYWFVYLRRPVPG